MKTLVATIFILSSLAASHSARGAGPSGPPTGTALAAPPSPPASTPAGEVVKPADSVAAAPSAPEAAKPAEAAPAEVAAPAQPAAPPVKPKGIYEGMFTFDWKRLSKCQVVGPVTNAMLTDPNNICKKADKETGGPANCKISPKSEYLIFKTIADCKVEYEEQLKASP